MAEYEERSLDDLTEEPTPHRLEELRQRGMITFSRELVSAIVLFGVMLLLYFSAGAFLKTFTAVLKEIFSKDLIHPPDVTDWAAIVQVAGRCGRLLAASFLPIALVSTALAILSSIAQTGFVYSTDVIEPDFSRIDPVKGFFKIFSLRNLVMGGKSILKLATVTGVVFYTVKSQFFLLPSTIAFEISQLLIYIGTTTFKIFSVVWIFLMALAGLDYWMQWIDFRKQARMTKQEAKQEAKEREGDPQVKARIRSIQRDMARKRMMKSVPKADVIVTNPTHIAVALQYDPDQMAAPRVVAKGADFLAQRIKEIARNAGIPMVENKPLARSLYKSVKVGQMVPRSLYQAVAEILAYVYRLRGKTRVQMEQNKTL